MAANVRGLFRWLRIAGTAVVCLLILGAAGVAVVAINRTEPQAEQLDATRKSAALVETITVERRAYRPQLVVLGTVTAAQDIVLSPRVSGEVVEVAPSFVPGKTVRKGELLLRIDPADFTNALAIRESELKQARASLTLEEGRRDLAKKELALLEDSLGETNRDLVLRVPQIESMRAEVKAAEASLEQAKLDLQRTSIYAPFDAQILRRSVNVGSQVSPGDDLSRLVGIEEYWIMAAVPVRSLRWLQFADEDDGGSPVTLRNPGTWPPGATRQARVANLIGTVDEQSRLASVLIAVADPLATTNDVPPLIIDTLVEAQIEGRPIENVIRLDRQYVREQDTVWVMQDGKLDIRQTDVVFRDAAYAYIRSGLENGDEVVTTTLATVAAGIGLKKADGGDAEADANVETESAATEAEAGGEPGN